MLPPLAARQERLLAIHAFVSIKRGVSVCSEPGREPCGPTVSTGLLAAALQATLTRPGCLSTSAAV